MDDQLDEPSDDLTDDLTADVTVVDGHAVVALAGEIDIATRDLLTTACRDAVANGAERLVLDMAAVTFMDSSGIAVLIDTRSIAAVTLRTPSDAVRRLLEATGLTDTFEFEP